MRCRFVLPYVLSRLTIRTSAERNQERSPLLRLPPELRIIIFELALNTAVIRASLLSISRDWSDFHRVLPGFITIRNLYCANMASLASAPAAILIEPPNSKTPTSENSRYTTMPRSRSCGRGNAIAFRSVGICLYSVRTSPHSRPSSVQVTGRITDLAKKLARMLFDSGSKNRICRLPTTLI